MNGNQFFGWIFFQKCSNLHERCGICRNEWKIIFPIFILVIFVRKYGKYSPKHFHPTLEKKNRKKIVFRFSFFLFSSSRIFHKNLITSDGRGRSVCITLVGKKRALYMYASISLHKRLQKIFISNLINAFISLSICTPVRPVFLQPVFVQPVFIQPVFVQSIPSNPNLT